MNYSIDDTTDEAPAVDAANTRGCNYSAGAVDTAYRGTVHASYNTNSTTVHRHGFSDRDGYGVRLRNAVRHVNNSGHRHGHFDKLLDGNSAHNGNLVGLVNRDGYLERLIDEHFDRHGHRAGDLDDFFDGYRHGAGDGDLNGCWHRTGNFDNLFHRDRDSKRNRTRDLDRPGHAAFNGVRDLNRNTDRVWLRNLDGELHWVWLFDHDLNGHLNGHTSGDNDLNGHTAGDLDGVWDLYWHCNLDGDSNLDGHGDRNLHFNGNSNLDGNTVDDLNRNANLNGNRDGNLHRNTHLNGNRDGNLYRNTNLNGNGYLNLHGGANFDGYRDCNLNRNFVRGVKSDDALNGNLVRNLHGDGNFERLGDFNRHTHGAGNDLFAGHGNGNSGARDNVGRTLNNATGNADGNGLVVDWLHNRSSSHNTANITSINASYTAKTAISAISNASDNGLRIAEGVESSDRVGVEWIVSNASGSPSNKGVAGKALHTEDFATANEACVNSVREANRFT